MERARIAASNEAKRQNLARKELAWLRRGAPARSSKPRYRVEAANALITNVPEPRDKLELARFSATRLGNALLVLANTTNPLTGRSKRWVTPMKTLPGLLYFSFRYCFTISDKGVSPVLSP